MPGHMRNVTYMQKETWIWETWPICKKRPEYEKGDLYAQRDLFMRKQAYACEEWRLFCGSVHTYQDIWETWLIYAKRDIHTQKETYTYEKDIVNAYMFLCIFLRVYIAALVKHPVCSSAPYIYEKDIVNAYMFLCIFCTCLIPYLWLPSSNILNLHLTPYICEKDIVNAYMFLCTFLHIWYPIHGSPRVTSYMFIWHPTYTKGTLWTHTCFSVHFYMFGTLYMAAFV